MHAPHVSVEAIIPVHRPDRPVLRAVKSFLDGLEHSARATVVCHNMHAEDLEAYSALAELSQVRFLHCTDGKASPAGPRNLALRHANATWVCTLDSDDYLEPGAVQGWLELGEKTNAAAVVPRHRRASGPPVRTPVKRPRTTVLDPVLDRLPYRVGHLGLTRLSAVRDLSLRYSPDLPTGEDLAFSMPLWFAGGPAVYANDLPAYVVNDDDSDHVSGAARPVTDQLAGVRALVGSPFFRSLTPEQRHVTQVKLLRGDVLSTARRLASEPQSDPKQTRELARILRDVVFSGADGEPDPLKQLSFADARLVRRTLRAAKLGESLQTADAARSLVTMVLPVSVQGAFSRQGPLRFAFASALMR